MIRSLALLATACASAACHARRAVGAGEGRGSEGLACFAPWLTQRAAERSPVSQHAPALALAAARTLGTRESTVPA
ncbi:MAG: hypothetical protein ACKO1N_02945 [Erythrobacter sp.]